MQLNKNGCPYEGLPAKCGFSIKRMNNRELFETTDKEVNYLLFLLEGSLNAKSNLFNTLTVKEGEALFLPRTAVCQLIATEDSMILIHQFDNSLCRPEFCIINTFHICNYECTSQSPSYILPTSKIIDSFLKITVEYLNEHQKKNIDLSIWQLKHKELIRLFRYSYPRSELHSFFYSEVNNELPFKTKVLKFYPIAHDSNELSELCGYGISTFRRIFLQEFGVTVYKWMQQQKSSHILYRLQNSDIPLADIIHEFDFSSAQQFSRYCKLYLGDTPTNLRNKKSPNDSSGCNC